MSRSPISRRSFLRIAGTAAGLSVAIAACGATPTATPVPKPTAAPTSAPAQPTATKVPAATSGIKRGGKCVMTTTVVDNLDPHVSSLNIHEFFGAIFDSLTALSVDPNTLKSTLSPSLADSWEYAADAKSVTFRLRKGVKFHDGSEWNSDVAVWNILRMRDDAKSGSKDLFTDVSDVKAVDASSFKVSFTGPNVVFPLTMSAGGSTGRSRMMSKAAFEKLGADGFGLKPSGTGPFRFLSWTKGDRITLERNPDYWRAGDDGKALPYLDGLVIREVSDEPTILAEMKAGTIHWAMNQLAAATATALQSEQNIEIYFLKEYPSYFMIGCNAKNGNFAKFKQLRQAIAHAIDRDAILKALSPLGQPAYQFVEAGRMGNDPSLKYPYDTAKAKALLAEAGFPNGMQIQMLTWNREAWKSRAAVYQQQLEQIGIKSTIEALEGVDWKAKCKTNQGYDIALWGEGERADPDAMSRFMTSGGQGNWMNFELADIDKLFSDARAELDANKRDVLYKQAAKLFFDVAYVIPIYKELSPYAKRKELRWQAREFGIRGDIATFWLA